MFWSIYLAALFAAWAMMVREGMWSNAISLVNILLSGLVAFGFYSPLVIYLDELTSGSNTYWLDFIVIWALFLVSMLVFRGATDFLSRTRMRFKYPIDTVGGPVVGLIAAWVLAAFVMATLHTSPMPPDAFSGKLIHSDSEVDTASALTAPDLGWLRFVEQAIGPDSFGAEGKKAYSAKWFVQTYAEHRTKFAKGGGLRVKRS